MPFLIFNGWCTFYCHMTIWLDPFLFFLAGIAPKYTRTNATAAQTTPTTRTTIQKRILFKLNAISKKKLWITHLDIFYASNGQIKCDWHCCVLQIRMDCSFEMDSTNPCNFLSLFLNNYISIDPLRHADLPFDSFSRFCFIDLISSLHARSSRRSTRKALPVFVYLLTSSWEFFYLNSKLSKSKPIGWPGHSILTAAHCDVRNFFLILSALHCSFYLFDGWIVEQSYF